MNTDTDSRHPIEELAEQFVDRYRRGERPSIEEYCALRPDQAEEIRDLFPALVLMENHAPAPKRSDSADGPSRESTPARIGDYRIVRERGRGGMGIVYEAEHQFLRRRVALKVLPRDLGLQADRLQRFERESQAAARLQHPHIVSVFEVGVSDGVHFIAMQFVEGSGLDEVLRLIAANQDQLAPATLRPDSTRRHPPVPPQGIAAHSHVSAPPDSTPLSNRSEQTALLNSAVRHKNPRQYFSEVARLGLHVAQALTHAHEQGIIHRDIKPSNLLLDRHGSVWVADFGLAKAGDAVQVTHTGDVVGTLRYMAPEQFHGWSDPRTDICGLGLTLYELLTLRPAYDADSRAALIRQITYEEPARLAIHNRHIPRDLETIVLKAVEKEPSRRYQSAADMADDLERFLNDTPIRARRATTTEYVWRWCRHNPALATTTAAMVLAFVVGFAGVFWQWQRAEHHLTEIRRQEGIATSNLAEADRQRNRAEASLAEVDKQRSLANSSFNQARKALSELFDVVGDDPLLDEPMMVPLRKKMLDTLLEYDRGFVQQRGDDPRIQAELVASYVRVAAIANRSGARTEALAAYRKALEIRRKLATTSPDHLPYQSELAGTLHDIGYKLHELGQLDDARVAYEEAITIRNRILESSPKNRDYRQGLASTYRNLGYLLRASGHDDKAWPLYDTSLAITKQLADEQPESDANQFNLATIYCNIGVFKTEVRLHDDALDVLTKARDMMEALVQRRPGVMSYRQMLANVYNRLGDVHRGRRAGGWEHDAWTWYRKAQQFQEELVGEYPRVAVLQTDLANTYTNTADVHRHVGDRDQKPEDWKTAIELFGKSRIIQEKLQQTGMDAIDVSVSIGHTYERSAYCLVKLGQREEAMTAFDAAIACLRPTSERSNIARYRSRFCQLYLNLAAVQREWGEADKSLASCLAARSISPQDANLLYNVAREIMLSAKNQHEVESDSTNSNPTVNEEFVEQAMAVLHEAVAAGFVNLRRLREDEAFAPLRQRSQYKSLVQRAQRGDQIVKLTKTIAAKPDDANNYVKRGNIHEQLEQSELATADFQRAIDLYSRALQSNNADIESLRLRGELYLRLKKFDSAIADFNAALGIKPDQVVLLTSRAHAYAGLRQFDQAIVDCTRIIELEPKNTTIYIGRALLHNGKREFDKTIANYQRVLEIDPNHHAAQKGLAWVYIIAPPPLRNPEAALPLAESAVAYDPNDWPSLSTLGTVQYRLGQWDKAIDTLNRTIVANKKGATGFELFTLAMSHHRRGDVDRARRYFDEAVEWIQKQTDLTEDWIIELGWFRDEAEEVLQIKGQ